MTADIRRRSVLSGLGAGITLAAGLPLLSLAGCASTDDTELAAQDQAALDQVLAGELALVGQAQQVSGATARQAALAHQAHADALVAAGGVAPAPASTPATGATSTTASALAVDQRKQSAEAARLALGATPRIARLLSSIAASDASFALLLGGGR